MTRSTVWSRFSSTGVRPLTMAFAAAVAICIRMKFSAEGMRNTS